MNCNKYNIPLPIYISLHKGILDSTTAATGCHQNHIFHTQNMHTLLIQIKKLASYEHTYFPFGKLILLFSQFNTVQQYNTCVYSFAGVMMLMKTYGFAVTFFSTIDLYFVWTSKILVVYNIYRNRKCYTQLWLYEYDEYDMINVDKSNISSCHQWYQYAAVTLHNQMKVYMW